MTTLSTWLPQEIESVRQSYPELLTQPLRVGSERRSLRVGELVKIIVRIDDVECISSLYRRWVVVKHVSTDDPIRYAGDMQADPGGKMPPDGDTCIEFRPEHVYRMPPRAFTLWGDEGIPAALAGNGDRPCDRDGNERVDCQEAICHFNALGWDAALAHYAEMAVGNPAWPREL